MKPPFIRSQYNYDTDQASRESGLDCKDKSLAQQHFRDEVDINTIVERFGLTGMLPQVTALPQSGDFTGIFDFQSALNTVRLAQEQFMALPAKMRARFHNNPQELLVFLEDDENRPEAEKLGLVKPVEKPTPPPEPAPKAPETPPK